MSELRKKIIATLNIYGGDNGEYLSQKRDLVDALTKQAEGLLEQRNELLAVLKMVRSNNMQFGLDSSKRRVLRLEPDEWELLDQSIKNTTT